MSDLPIPTHAASPVDSQSPPPITGEKKSHHVPKVRRRNRLITSCLECRRRKLKCDKGHPCANCTKISRPCVFIASGLDADAQAKLAEVKEKMGMLERSLEANVARKAKANSSSASASLNIPGQDLSYSDQDDDDDDTKDLDPSGLATEDAAYYEDEGNDDLVDLGIAMGKVRLTERIGGLVRPRISEELSVALANLPPNEYPNLNPVSEQDPMNWLAPSRDYVAPSSSFFFAPGLEKTSLMTHLPSKVLVDKLIDHYWIAVHVIARTVHRPSFERQYHNFWVNINSGIEPRISFHAVLFAALLSSVVSMSEEKVLSDFGVDKQSLVKNFREGTEAALSRANFLRTTKLETIQAFVMYLIPLCRNEVSRAHSALTGSLIRLAECMGLHRDPTTYNTSPIEIHVRRLIWYQICFLDIRTCEATGPRPQIRPDDYDTRFPLNIDDVDLDRAENGDFTVDVKKDRTYFTDMTITRIRFECYEMHRLLWNERPKLDRKRQDGERKVTITTLLSRVQSFKAVMEKTYVPMLRKSQPLHALASEMYGILSDRLYILLLQKYLSSPGNKMPNRLRQLVIGASVMIIERSMVIEQQPALAPWIWYVGALHQYHVALLLLSELYAGSRDPALEQRVWKCLDFAFDIPSEIPILQKVRTVLEDLIEKTSIYSSMKKVRAPNNMPRVGVSKGTPASQSGNDENREARQRSESLHSTASSDQAAAAAASVGMSNSPIIPGAQLPQQFLRQQAQRQNEAAMSFSELVPQVDWGSVDLPASSSLFQQGQQTQQQQTQQSYPSPEPYKYNDFAPTSPPGGYLSPSMMANAGQQRHGSDAGSPGSAVYNAMATGTTGSSPMDALNEIDWNEIDQMFGGAEMGAGNILIPPFTFPQFSATDLQQWPKPEGL